MLLDRMMPLLNGWEVLERMQKDVSTPRPIVIVLTAGTEPRDLPADLVAGTVRKPFDVELLVDGVFACIAALPSQQQIKDCPPADSDRKNTSNLN